MKKLLWRCDDFGSATGANEGIIRVARLGLPVNVSVLICGPTAQAGVEELAQLGPHVCFGVHAAVNCEWEKVKWGPVCRHELADPKGHFYPDCEIISKLPPEIIAAEIEGQIKRAQEWNVPFAYLDEHMGFGWIPGVAPLLTALAEKHGLIFRRHLPGLPAVEDASPDLVQGIAQQLDAVVDENPRIAVFHPALDDESTRKFVMKGGRPGEVSSERQREVDALTSPAWQKLVSRGDVELITYRDA